MIDNINIRLKYRITNWESNAIEQKFGEHLVKARERRSLSQRQLASAAGLHQSDISQFEQGKRIPTFEQLLTLAVVLRVSLQWFLSGANQPGDELEDIAFQLQGLGISDLHVPAANIPGAFRSTEEVLAIALAGNSPSARIIEAIPAVLAWNDWRPLLLRANARAHGKKIDHRLAWLADIAITIQRGQGFPGGCPSLRSLEEYVEAVRPPKKIDTVGFAAGKVDLPPVSLRWKVHYPAQLDVFRARAAHLLALRTKEERS